jgi:glycosyltransferase involved in cell wall biosynthesis
MGRAIGASRPDVLVTRDLGVAAFLLRLPRSLRPPLVYESHGYAPDVAAALPALVATASTPSTRKLRRLATREAATWSGAEGYVTITRGLAEALEERFGARARVSVIPDGVRLTPDAGGSGNDLAPPAGRPVVAYAGHLYAWKGVDVLLEALAALPEVDGLIVGGHEREPDLARTQALARTLGVSERVTFAGRVDPPRVRAMLAGAAVLALPNPASAISSRFTSPLKLFEYMAAGRPIVASDLPALREVLTPDVHAVLVPPGHPLALAGGIRRVLSDPAFGARLGSAAAAAALEYTWDRRAERLEALLDSVTGGRA